MVVSIDRSITGGVTVYVRSTWGRSAQRPQAQLEQIATLLRLRDGPSPLTIVEDD
jgi:hypothetical protein